MHRIQPPANNCVLRECSLFMTAACKAALTAGTLIRTHYNLPHTISMKGRINLVTETDFASEEAIISSLKMDTPELPVMAEESATSHGHDLSDRIWVVDPLDGTTNFAHGFPFFAVSIALLEQGKPLVGVIYAPMFDELFCASKGGGAWLNGHPIKVTQSDQLVEALIATGFPYDREKVLPDVMNKLGNILAQARDVRRAGAAALDLAYVSCGRLDAFYEMNLQPWDTTAGWLLVEEAGGRVSNFADKAYSPFLPEILASNGRLHHSLVSLLS